MTGCSINDGWWFMKSNNFYTVSACAILYFTQDAHTPRADESRSMLQQWSRALSTSAQLKIQF